MIYWDVVCVFDVFEMSVKWLFVSGCFMLECVVEIV